MWGLPSDEEFEIQGSPEFAKSLARDVLGLGVDVAYSYEKREGLNFPHAFANTQAFLDWDSASANFPYPIVALAVNCYGEHVIGRRGVSRRSLRSRMRCWTRPGQHRCGASSSVRQSQNRFKTAISG